MIFRVIQIFVYLLTTIFFALAIWKVTQPEPESAEAAAHFFEIKFYFIIGGAGILLSILLYIFVRKVVRHI